MENVPVVVPKKSDLVVPEQEPEIIVPLPSEEPEPEPEPSAPKMDGDVPIVSEIPRVMVPEASLKNLIMFHCLPATTQVYKDELYGEEREEVSYGKKFAFEGVMLEMSDLAIVYWSPMEIRKNFIVYPSKYVNAGEFKDFRWYRVDQVEEKTGGFICRGIPTNINPDFT